MIKWSKKDCIKAITELKSPLEDKANKQNDPSPSIQKMRKAKPSITAGRPVR